MNYEEVEKADHPGPEIIHNQIDNSRPGHPSLKKGGENTGIQFMNQYSLVMVPWAWKTISIL